MHHITSKFDTASFIIGTERQVKINLKDFLVLDFFLLMVSEGLGKDCFKKISKRYVQER